MTVGIFPGGKCLLRISGGGDNIVVTTGTAGIRIDGNYKQTGFEEIVPLNFNISY